MDFITIDWKKLRTVVGGILIGLAIVTLIYLKFRKYFPA